MTGEHRSTPALVGAMHPAALVDQLLADLDEPSRRAAARRIAAAIRDGYRRMGRPEPAWLSTDPRSPALPYPELDIKTVREFTQDVAKTTSVRATAREIGLNHQSLEKFLDGAEPYARLRSLIRDWYLRRTRPPDQGEPSGLSSGGLSPSLPGVWRRSNRAGRMA
jgi:hypothetical protein